MLLAIKLLTLVKPVSVARARINWSDLIQSLTQYKRSGGFILLSRGFQLKIRSKHRQKTEAGGPAAQSMETSDPG